MSSFKTFYRVTRPLVCLTSFVGTWAAAALFSQQLFTPQNIAAATVMGLSCLASSLYYSAMAHKRQQDSTISGVWLPLISGPAFPQWKKPLLIGVGILALIITAIVARYLPLASFMVIFYTAWMVCRYTKLDGSEPFWLKRSMYGAGIAACCVLFSGAAVNADLNPANTDVYLVGAVVYFLFLLREILKYMQVANINSTHNKFPINVGDTNSPSPANLGTQGMLGMIALMCIMPLAVIMLFARPWMHSASPNVIISQFIATSAMVFILWIVGSIILGIINQFDDPPMAFRPLHGLYHVVTACTWLMVIQTVVYVM